MYCENNTTLISPENWLTVLLLIGLTIEERLQILGKRGGVYVQKCHLRYKTSDISETKLSAAKVTFIGYMVSLELCVGLRHGLSTDDKSGDLNFG